MNRLCSIPKIILFLFILSPSFVDAQTLEFEISDYDSGGGDSIRVDISLQNWDSIYSFQYTIRWDTAALTYLDVGNFGMPEMDYSSFGYSGVDEGFLITLWTDLNVVGYTVADSTTIFSIYFEAPCGGTGDTDIFFSNNPINILASTLDEEFVPDTISGGVNFVPLDAGAFTVDDVSCNGASDGCITMMPAGGTAPFTYAWSNGGTGQQLCGLASGAYTCTITDAGNCTAISPSMTVNEPEELEFCGSSIDDATCPGESDGCIDLTVCGGVEPYTYLWMPGGATSEDTCGLVAGTYSCIATDMNNCTVTIMNLVVGEPVSMNLMSFDITNATCDLGGSIDIEISGGSSPYEYLWSNGETTKDIDDLTAGFYTCTVTDDNDCEFITMQLEVILENSDLGLNGSTQMNVSCFGGNDGSIDLDVAGTATPFMFIWSNGDTDEDITDLIAGTYTCTITDADGCEFITPAFEITEPATALVVDNVTVDDLDCFGDADACIEIEISGGNAPYDYLWSNGAGTTMEVCDLPAGDYTCTITDAGGCSIISATITVTEPPLLEDCGIVVDDVSCAGGDDACIDITICGGVGPYAYLWMPGGMTTEDVCDLEAGTYSCEVTDANDCIHNIIDIVVGEPDPMELDNSTIVNATCAQGGSIDITVDGGNPPYDYDWSNGDTTEDITDLVAGFYTCTVTDSDDCTFTTVALEVVLENSDLEIDGSSQQNVSCFGGDDGSIDIDVSGSGTPFDFDWSNGDTTEDIDGLSAGSYSCTITDVNGCVVTTQTFEITEPATALVVDNVTVDDLDCFGDTDACIEIEITGGNAPYGYLWSDGAGTTMEVCDLPAGDYTCTITDAGGCSIISGTITVTEPPLLEACGIVVDDVSCAGGDDGCIDITICGGVGPYTYLWMPGAMTTEDVCDLAAGTYSCEVTDANNCIHNIIDIVVGEPESMELDNSTIINATCAQGGSIDITIGGGNPPYDYDWNNGDTTEDIDDLFAGFYTCTVTDSDGCTFTTVALEVILENSDLEIDAASQQDISCFGEDDGSIDINVIGSGTPFDYEWSNGETTQDIDDLPGGSYVCTITDANGCVVTTQTFEIIEPGILEVDTETIMNLSCFGEADGSIAITMVGGTTPYEYLWSNGGTTSLIDDLPAGMYTCVITDANDCIAETISYEITEPTAIVLDNAVITDATCGSGGASGDIDITISGGNPTYSYEWSNGDLTEDLTDVVAGNYNCTITDLTSCTFITQTFTVESDGGDLSVDNIIAIDINCIGANNGSIELEVSGTATPFMFAWSNGASSQNIMNLPTGTYTCTITDANDCVIITESVTIEEPATGVSVNNLTGTDASCSDSNDGSIDLSASGGTTPYMYDWSNGGTTQDLVDLAPGSYTCVITDGNDCSVTTMAVVIGAPSSIAVELVSSNNASCGQGGSNGSIDIDVDGGTPLYSYMWSNGATTQDITGIPAGSYTCVITDLAGCTFESPAYSISNDGSNLMYNGAMIGHVNCFGDSDGFVDINITGTATPLTYMWNTGAVTEDLMDLSGGDYICTITNANGCTTVTPIFNVDEPISELGANLLSLTNTCSGDAGGSISIEGTGGSPLYDYMWNNGASGTEVTDLPTGIYTCEITDANGCTFTTIGYEVMSFNSDLEITSSVSEQISCFGVEDGFVDLDVTGTVLPITYSWNNGATTEDLAGLGVGTYSCVITDGNGCTVESESFTIDTPTAIEVLLVGTMNASCGQGGDGSIDIDVLGGTIDYTFAWSNGTMTEDLNGVSAGIYNCTITDANGCTLVTPDYNIINSDSDLNLNSTTSGNVNCFGESTGFINLDVSGTATPIIYAWNTGDDDQNLSGLPAGQYSCTITDGEGCTAITPIIEITEPEAALSNVADQVAAACTGNDNGSVAITVSGGTDPYTYTWSNGAMTEDLDNLPAGNYTCTIIDAEGCELVTETYEIINVDSDLTVVDFVTTTVSCTGENNGALSINPTGTATPFTYQWSNGETTQNLTDLFAGFYMCTITDANGCIFITENYEVDEPEALAVCNANIQHPLCEGVADGCIDLEACGGSTTGAYTYLWSNGDVTANPCGLAAGIYNCTITDANGCSTVSPVYELETTADPITLDASMTTNANCGAGGGGSVDITIGGGLAPYTYLWNNGAMTEDLMDVTAGVYTCTVTDINGCEFVTNSFQIDNDGSDLMLTAITSQNIDCFGTDSGSIDISVNGSADPFTYMWSNGETTQDLDNLSPGLYSCTVTDAADCSIVILEVSITQPEAALAVDISQTFSTPVSCFGLEDGAINLTIEGGTEPYAYEWSNGSMDPNLSDLQVGAYTCTVTDANDCMFPLTIEVLGPFAISLVTGIITNETGGMSNGGIDFEVEGGSAPYTYLWDDPAGATTEDLMNVSAGNYTCIVTDANGCTAEFGVFIIQDTDAVGDIENPGFEVYPNPFSQRLTLLLDQPATDIEVIDLTGRVVYKEEQPGLSLNKQLQLDLPTGMYVMKVRFDDGSVGLVKVVSEIVDSR